MIQFTFADVAYSLSDLAGEGYVQAACQARAALSGESFSELLDTARKRVSFYPAAWHERLLERLPEVGQKVCDGLDTSAAGAGSQAFTAATNAAAAPLTGYGLFRVGEDGRLYLLTKSEHYHTPLGHSFPGYELLEIARSLGIPNATHNNTRGHITRLLEEELVRAAHGLDRRDAPGLQTVLADRSLNGLNRVLNLETGSLAVEAGVKMMLARFYRVQDDSPEPVYSGRVPVFLVMGNDDGGLLANYHGTTVLTQILRGMWPGLAESLTGCETLRVCPIRPNRVEDLEDAFAQFEQPPYKIAGFIHEIVMMNYGAVVLAREFLHRAYELCAQCDVPTMVDEIQSCLWAPGLFQYREYGLKPSMVVLGKGFPGGEYPASRLLFSAGMDSLPQFGALVTNGQEELASLAYLVTMRWAQDNGDAVGAIGDEYEAGLRELAARHPETVAGINGRRHMGGIAFRDLQTAKAFTSLLNARGLDISVQTYKSECPPTALTKLPITVCRKVVGFVIDRIAEALDQVKGGV
ncbi:MAG: aminotransferase class III-fold pyridoxal phosphate-dependent enzyme [Armatimonadetes bacterium]|nr:aminotransferase class III-fold pyridoxal phosphate-dependent enzyme [Armatimonadota bacterium]